MTSRWKVYCLVLLSMLVYGGAPRGFPPLRAASAPVDADALIVAVDPNSPPFVFADANGNLTGFDIEFMNALANAADLKIVYARTPFPSILPGVATRQYDISENCIFVTEARKKMVDFTEPYFTTGIVLAVSKRTKTVHTLADLMSSDVAVSVRKGSTAETYARQQTKAQVRPIISMPVALQDLANGKIDAIITDELEIVDFIRTHPDAELEMVGGLLTYDQCAIAVNKWASLVLVKLNAAFDQLKANGQYAVIYHKWFGDRKIVEKPETEQTPVAVNQPPSAPTATPSVNTSQTSSQTVANQWAGMYYLTEQAASAERPATYRIVTLTADGLWFESETVQNRALITGSNMVNMQQGMWQVSAADQIKATVLTFTPASADGRMNVMRKDYAMTVQADGAVAGSYTLNTYDLSDDLSRPTTSQPATQTIEFTGQRVQVGQ